MKIQRKIAAFGSLLLFCVLFLFMIGCAEKTPYKDPTLPIEKRVNDLLARMTLEEKAAQLDMLAANDILDDSETINEEKLRFYIESMNIGSIHDLYPVSAALANKLQKHAVENSRLGIPLIFIEEALHGYQGAGATCFPIPMGNATSWDTTLIYNIGRVIATEARAHGIHFVLGPNLDLARDIRWGRVEETFGEDTYLSSRMGVNLVKGLQGENLSDPDAVVAEPKHFALHGSPESGSNTAPVFIGEREARSTGLYVFEKAVKEAGAKGIMAAYHEMDGIPTIANKWLLTDILRNEWGFDGFVVADLGAVRLQISKHKTAQNEEEAIVNAITAGLDMQFYDFPYDTYQNTIIEAVRNGKLEEKYVDRAVKGILRAKFMLGLFDNPYTDESLLGKVFHTTENQQLALDAAHQSIVLLQNKKQVLPIDNNIKRITLTGNLANSTYTGGYSPAGAKAISVYESLKTLYGNDVSIDYVGTEVSDRFSNILPGFLSPSISSDEEGLKAEYFNNHDLSGQAAYSTVEANLNPYWHNLSPAPGINPNSFSVRWSGYLTVPTTGTYEFEYRADDYGRIFINDELFIDHWKEDWRNRGERYKIKLEAGKQIPIRIELAKLEGNAGMWMNWRLSDVESSNLYTNITQSAQKSDMVIVVMGEAREEVGESRDKQNLYPHKMDMDILKAASKAGKPVVTVMLTGRPLILTEVCEYTDALLQCWFPGEATGIAVNNVLFGKYNPSGKLTVSFPKTLGQLPVYYSKKPSSGRSYVDGNGDPLFPFGYGLSYTSFEYSDLKIEPENPTIKDHVTVSLSVTNTGEKDGTEIVQLYINDVLSSVATPVKELKGFSKLHLKAGETQKVTMTLTPEHFSLINPEMQRVVEPGEFEIMLGSSSSDIYLKDTITIK